MRIGRKSSPWAANWSSDEDKDEPKRLSSWVVWIGNTRWVGGSACNLMLSGARKWLNSNTAQDLCNRSIPSFVPRKTDLSMDTSKNMRILILVKFSWAAIKSSKRHTGLELQMTTGSSDSVGVLIHFNRLLHPHRFRTAPTASAPSAAVSEINRWGIHYSTF